MNNQMFDILIELGVEEGKAFRAVSQEVSGNLNSRMAELERDCQKYFYDLHRQAADVCNEITSLKDRFDCRMAKFEGRLDGLETHVLRIETRIDGLDGRIGKIGNRIDGLDSRMGRIENRIDGLENRMDGMGNRMDKLENRMDKLETNQQLMTQMLHEHGMMLKELLSRK